ncbi:sigma-70 family RNA polymerase sigma factor [Paenibacillus albiflavus]|uniref:Sigma-70 family RNA polymerase sigma factor n=1 Tax=Paenibacillus albiflavus TaxID=2545760 RepID=A0A4R4E403_9BACL|nr:sigma-70 family RNA polymerase sigma factor [Paenibacillus albiflavus]
MLSGDQRAFGHLVKLYQTYIYRLVFSVVKNHADAEDITQEAFVQIYRSLPQYQSKGLKTWMSRIAINKAIDHRRKTNRLREDTMLDLVQLASPNLEHQHESPIEEQLLTKEARQLVHAHLQEIPDNYREVVQAYYFDHKSYQMIAEEQGITTKTVESKLYRAKQWMRKRWKEEDFE